MAWKRSLPNPRFSYDYLSPWRIYRYQKTRTFWCAQVIQGPEAVWYSSLTRFSLDFNSNRVLLRVLSDRAPFVSSGLTLLQVPHWWFFPWVIWWFFPWVISAYFLACCYFLSKHATSFLLKADAVRYIILSKRIHT